MKKIPLIIVVAILSGCATSNTTYLPSGEQGHSIDCSGTALTWGKCYEKAGELCGAKGYEIIAGGSEKGAVISADQGTVFGSTVMQRSMLVRCK
ncbi:hypothetical protein [uncultured Methylophaga sp.]|uniref:hypothetical protein n=1 Tax=uncultured Methylophaga sp. TaxID=285271 RepID=UPI002624D674|nr:hypothetical protein [uncultured Methylophaga sp.]